MADMQRPHDINCDCEHCTYTKWVVRETMKERDDIIAKYHEAMTKAVNDLECIKGFESQAPMLARCAKHTLVMSLAS
jgi:hypothetical protein